MAAGERVRRQTGYHPAGRHRVCSPCVLAFVVRWVGGGVRSVRGSPGPRGFNCAPLHKRNPANSRGRAKKVRDPPVRGSSRVCGGEAARARVPGVRLHCERQESSGFGSVSLRRGCVGVFDACCELRLVPGASAHLEQSVCV